MAVKPLLDLLYAALVYARPLGKERESLRPTLLVSEYLLEPALKSPLTVLKRQVEHVAPTDDHFPECVLVLARYGRCEPQDEPRLTDFRLATQDRRTLRQ